MERKLSEMDGEYRHTLKDAIADITIKPLTGIPVAIAVLYGLWAFFSYRCSSSGHSCLLPPPYAPALILLPFSLVVIYYIYTVNARK